MKKTITALTAVALLAAGISGASAATAYSSIASCSALDGSSGDWSTVPLEDKLDTLGIEYDSIGTFADCFRVVSTNDDGSTQILLYDPNTLSQLHM